MGFVCASAYVKKKGPYLSPGSGQGFWLSPVCRRLKPGLSSACFGTGPCFPITAVAALGQLVSPALFSISFFSKQHGKVLDPDVKQKHPLKILKMVRVSKHPPTHAHLPVLLCLLSERHRCSAQPRQGYLAAHDRSIFNTRSFLFPFLQQPFPLPTAELPGKARPLQAPGALLRPSQGSSPPERSCSRGPVCRDDS